MPWETPTVGNDEEDEFTAQCTSNDDDGDIGLSSFPEDEFLDEIPPHNNIEYSSYAWCSWHYLVSHWKILVGGQLLSFLLATAGAAQATLHKECGLSAPTFSLSLIYFLLSFHLVPVIWRQHRQQQYHKQPQHQEELEGDYNASSSSFGCCGLALQRPIWQYLIIAFLDVQANAVTVLSFRYTTLTSVTLFDAFAIPSAMVVSKLFLGRQYTRVHLMGVLLCTAGVVFNVLQDYESEHQTNNTSIQQTPEEVELQENVTDTVLQQLSNSSTINSTMNPEAEYPHMVRGDLLAISGGILFGVNDVFTEATVRHNGDTTEYLGVMGLFAFVICFTQALVLEWQGILDFLGRATDVDSNNMEGQATCALSTSWALLFVFVGVTVVSYRGGSTFLLVSEAAFFNLSLLTGDLWSVLFSIVAERIIPQPMFFGALLFVLSGVILYEMAPSPVIEDNDNHKHSSSNNGRLTTSDGEFQTEEDVQLRQ